MTSAALEIHSPSPKVFPRGASAFIAATLIAALACVAAKRANWAPTDGILKMTASTAFLATALACGALRSRYGRILLAGLFCSWWGDLFLIGSGESWFLAGLASFFAAHVAYGLAYWTRGVDRKRAGGSAALLLLPAMLLARWLLPHVDAGMRGPVIAYMVVISLMVALAAGVAHRPGGTAILVGALLFYVSDIFVARQAFVAPGAINPTFGLPLYFAGQAVLASSAWWAVPFGARSMAPPPARMVES